MADHPHSCICIVCGAEFDPRLGCAADIKLVQAPSGTLAVNVMVCSGLDGC